MLRDVQGQCKPEKRWDERNILNSAIYIRSWDTEKVKILHCLHAPRFLWLGFFGLGFFWGGGCVFTALIPLRTQRFQLIRQ